MEAKKIKFSILIPAHNEEKYLPKSLKHIKEASKYYPNQVEIIVTANRCTDKTVEIAEKYGAKVVYEDAKNLAKIRNAGAKVAVGEIIVTVDADSYMSSKILTEIHKALEMGKNIGGFKEDLRVAEDIDFAKRLKGYGKIKKKKFIKLKKVFVTTSTRKFDEFRDWMYFKMLIRNLGAIRDLFLNRDKGKNKMDEILEKVFFNPKR